MITHDLGLVAGWADRVVVMHEGRVVEEGPVAAVFAAPQHEATQALVRAAGGAGSGSGSGAGPGAGAGSGSGSAASHGARSDAAAPSHGARSGALGDVPCEVPDSVRGGDGRTEVGTSHRSTDASHGARVALAAEGLARAFDGVPAVADVSFGLARGRVLGVIGASGSGKTTVARMLLGLETPDAGTVTLDGDAWVPLDERERRPRRHRMAAVVQDPGATFDERWSVERVLADAFTGGGERSAGGELGERVDAALAQVGLDPVLRRRSPLTLSGGQRQRLAIARALATSPEVIVLDEPVTALDATVQDAVLTLLERLRDETGVAMVFVSHDLRAVRRMADDVLVVHEGRVVEQGPAGSVFDRPTHAVTARLLHAAERLAAGPQPEAGAA